MEERRRAWLSADAVATGVLASVHPSASQEEPAREAGLRSAGECRCSSKRGMRSLFLLGNFSKSPTATGNSSRLA